MQIYSGFPSVPLARPAFLTIGNFDGVHRGHQALLGSMIQAARRAGALAGVLTFDPHPMAVLRPDVPLAYLTSPAERAQLIGALGADFALILPFTREIAATSAAEFMRSLVEHLRLRELWVGPDFALGRGREGNIERLTALGPSLGYQLHVVPPLEIAGEPVRSSRVRALLAQEGAVEEAAALLGRPYQVWGEVQRGAGRGHALGYPTANIVPPHDRLVPAHGIYACWAWLGQAEASAAGLPLLGVPAAVSIGTRPTFDNGLPTIEAYLLDFDGDLYGQNLGLSFVKRLRPELRFDGPAALIAQMERDVEATRALLAAPPDDAAPTGSGAAGSDQAGSEDDAPAGVSADREESDAQQGWQELRHTADWAIAVQADSQKQLFARSASAMYRMQDADGARPVTLARLVNVSADNASELLVAYLNRLLLVGEVAGEVYTRFAISEISEGELTGIAYGYHGTPGHTAIKAVTYYDLALEQTPEGWNARITFDV
jgi:riboflavin kinase / FMN adenylyltransferase